jgi:hypothetical protein
LKDIGGWMAMGDTVKFMRKLSDKRLDFGNSVRVFLNDGSERTAHCTLITCSQGQFVEWYDNATRKGLDATQIKGWLPLQEDWMSIEIKYVGGRKDGQTRRVRSLGEQKSVEIGIWREFDRATKRPTGREQREEYRFNRERREYVLVDNPSTRAWLQNSVRGKARCLLQHETKLFLDVPDKNSGGE